MYITIHDLKTTAVIDTIGAQLISLKDQAGTEYIWQRNPAYWGKSSPLLFPIVGNCRKDQTIIEETAWNLTKHGFCREMDFAVIEQTDTSAVFGIRDTEDTKKVYPYSFHLSLSYELKDGVLSMEYKVTNDNDRIMHYCIGAHPGFNCPMNDDSAFEDYQLVFEKEETISNMVYDCEKLHFDPSQRIKRLENSRILPITRELFKDDAVYFDDLKSRSVSLVHKETQKGVEVEFPGFETVAFWTPYPDDAPFVCVEPWNGSAIYATEDDEFIHKNHVQSLEAGEAKTYGLVIRIL
jgi:galactose mutarotase-like enzyme